MVGFLEKFPKLKGRDFYITGESYAGHYIPAISAYLANSDNKDINLKGSAIGNGWVDPYQQYPEYNKFSYENGLIKEWHHYLLNIAYSICQGLITLTDKVGLWPVALEECQLATTTILGNPIAPAFNVYDIRIPCEHPPLCYDLSNTEKFLERPEVVKALGVEGRTWTECNQVVHTFMLGDWM